MTCFPASSFPFLLFLFLTPSFFILFLFCLVGLILGPNWAFFSAFSPFLFFPRPGWASSFSLFSISLPFPSSLISYARLGLSFIFLFFPSSLFFLSFSFLVAVECSSLSSLSLFFSFLFLLCFFFNLGWAKPHWFSWAESHRIRLAPLLFLGLG